jgi:hypothetical protein
LDYRPPAPQTQVPQIIQNQPILLQWFTMEKLSQVVDLNWQQFNHLNVIVSAIDLAPFKASKSKVAPSNLAGQAKNLNS